ncbi:RNA polymerase sigma-70 factor, sigma-E family [Tessaracoccus bendigoensis DSM 12906]|uniref:RNA polymerase sigma-70 factor, sigma-E family n=1 Tax=Tessaracoccus bendigoensis DSM 12906 TaxID=1123357 RepID=A0A1M6JUE4_9ACTN|nr:SigE family RNA polymerase sigma factor [Tessaracoccus bendigoensis]SHJ50317.1 RNA polymerase sigma-70 factor, sigma-E family [Tessaracoccus bendigoensis DSM 12906]
MPDIESFVEARGGDLLRAAWTLTGDAHHAEDLLQTALAKSLGAYDRLANDHKFEAYLRTTMYRTYISWWRRRSWRSETPSEYVPEVRGSEATVELRLDVMRALETLPRMQRAVMTMRYVEDRPVAEVAEALGISEGTVKKYAHRGCATLRGSAHLQEV